MTIDRDALKIGITALLDALALEHPLGHQPEYAGRYVLKCPSGAELELMFEKSSKTPPNLWCLEKAVASLSTSAIKQQRSPASSLYTKLGKDGKANYGRHSGLEKMRQLGKADLVCFNPQTLEDVGRIIDTLFAASVARTTS